MTLTTLCSDSNLIKVTVSSNSGLKRKIESHFEKGHDWSHKKRTMTIIGHTHIHTDTGKESGCEVTESQPCNVALQFT